MSTDRHCGHDESFGSQAQPAVWQQLHTHAASVISGVVGGTDLESDVRITEYCGGDCSQPKYDYQSLDWTLPE